MPEGPSFYTERVDAIAGLMAPLERMQVGALLDRYVAPPGQWPGLSRGHVGQGGLCLMRSEATHRLRHGQPWVEHHLQTLHAGVSPARRSLDVSDERLASVLDYVGDEAAWTALAADLGRHTIRVSNLETERVRIDSTTAIGYAAVSDEGWFQFGHSQDQRPELPPLKVNVSALEPLGLAWTTPVVAGQAADDPR